MTAKRADRSAVSRSRADCPTPSLSKANRKNRQRTSPRSCRHTPCAMVRTSPAECAGSAKTRSQTHTPTSKSSSPTKRANRASIQLNKYATSPLTHRCGQTTRTRRYIYLRKRTSASPRYSKTPFSSCSRNRRSGFISCCSSRARRLCCRRSARAARLSEQAARKR